jgi:putative hydrolase of the HAD superfamily
VQNYNPFNTILGAPILKEVILFDLGGTLAHYYEKHEFPEILSQAISSVQASLRRSNLLRVEPEDIQRRVIEEDHESEDHRVRPLEGRLACIFRIDLSKHPDTADDLCRVFMGPIFARRSVYRDVVPTLEEARSKGIRTAIVSNTPWGSPSRLWREEVERLGLRGLIDEIVFCRDVGWRKPARQIFDYTLERLGASPDRCVFVGDDPRWDVVGPEAVGIETVLIDRHGRPSDVGKDSIKSLRQIWDRF